MTGAARLVAGSPRADAAVAVCVPVYQGVAHIERTLRSALAQTAAGVEIVVLDNACTDGTDAVLARFTDPRLCVWRNDATVPMAENLNRVIGLSHAPLVKLLPADDLLAPRCLELQVAALLADPRRVLVAGRVDLVDAADRVIVRSRFLRGLLGDHDRAAVLRRVVRHGANPIGPDPAATFRRSAFIAAGGYRGSTFADIDLWTRLLQHGTLHGQRETVAGFRVAPGTASDRTTAADRDALRQFHREVAAQSGVRRVDVLVGRAAAPLARWRREALFAYSRRRPVRG